MSGETHRCKWPGCERDVPLVHWACGTHWYRIPLRLRVRLNRKWQVVVRFQSGQALDHTARLHGTRSAAALRAALADYHAAEREILEWIAGVEPTPPAAA